MRTILTSIAALCIAAIARPAAAGDAICLWSNLPDDIRASVIEAYRQGGANGVQSIELPDKAVGVAATACGVLEEQAHDAGVAIGGYLYEIGASDMLERRDGISRVRLDGAWKALPAAEKAGMRAFGTAFAANTAPPKEALEAFRMFSAQFGVDVQKDHASPRSTDLFIYVMGRALREYGEARY